MNMEATERVLDVSGTEEDAIRNPRVGKLLIWMALALFAGIFWRVYQQYFGWACGESTASCYSRVWMPWLYASTTTYMVAGSAWYVWLSRGCKTCDAQRETLGEVEPRHEASHLWTLMGLILVLVVATYWGGSYYAEQDGSWHQVAIRDTAFTPAHIIIFYTAYPMFILFSIGGYLYARTRIPVLWRDKGFPFAWGLVMAATLMEISSVAFNEWSHSFWITEELFSAPFHWGFTIWTWMAIALFAIGGALFRRVLVLAPQTGSGQGSWNGRTWVFDPDEELPAAATEAVRA
jgi:methane/ammonia monooxygenase subunit C